MTSSQMLLKISRIFFVIEQQYILGITMDFTEYWVEWNRITECSIEFVNIE